MRSAGLASFSKFPKSIEYKRNLLIEIKRAIEIKKKKSLLDLFWGVKTVAIINNKVVIIISVVVVVVVVDLLDISTLLVLGLFYQHQSKYFLAVHQSCLYPHP